MLWVGWRKVEGWEVLMGVFGVDLSLAGEPRTGVMDA